MSSSASSLRTLISALKGSGWLIMAPVNCTSGMTSLPFSIGLEILKTASDLAMVSQTDESASRLPGQDLLPKPNTKSVSCQTTLRLQLAFYRLTAWIRGWRTREEPLGFECHWIFIGFGVMGEKPAQDMLVLRHPAACVHKPNVCQQDGTLWNTITIDDVVFCRDMRQTHRSNRLESEHFLQYGLNIREIRAVCKRWKTVSSNYPVNLFSSLDLDVWICHHGKEKG
jgi:hypothetical protein